MKNIYRIMFWGFVLVICLAAGIVGVITNNQLFKQRKNELESIINYYNNSKVLKDYRLRNVMVSATINKKDIIVTYEGVNKSTYKYVLYDGYLKTEYGQNDDFGKVSLMLMADAISMYYGNAETDTYQIFNSNQLYDYTFDDGISVKLNKGKYIAKLNLNKALNTNNSITNESDSTLENNSEEITNDIQEEIEVNNDLNEVIENQN